MTAIASTPSTVIQNALNDLQAGVDRGDDFRSLISVGYIGMRHLMEAHPGSVTQAMNEQFNRIVVSIVRLSGTEQPPCVAPPPVPARDSVKTNGR